jgi:CRISPR/Cas system-associated protein endoribonuclease Cas2
MMVLFDLPVAGKTDRRHYAQFRRFLMKEGLHNPALQRELKVN